jgi:hypothetical protein
MQDPGYTILSDRDQEMLFPPAYDTFGEIASGYLVISGPAVWAIFHYASCKDDAIGPHMK